MTWYIPLDDIYQVVAIGFFGGFITAVAIIGYLWFFIGLSDRIGFKRYYLELSDKNKDIMRSGLGTIEHNLEFMARRTNTRYFRKLYNRFIRFKEFINEKYIQN